MVGQTKPSLGSRYGAPLKPPPIKPQLALPAVLPDDEGWVYEPKYDGFRALAFVDGDDVYLQSRGGKPLRRYFPEVEFPKGRYVIDGELVILGEDGARSSICCTDPSGRVAGEDARREDAGALPGIRRSGHRSPQAHGKPFAASAERSWRS
jgi:hypothetical protein